MKSVERNISTGDIVRKAVWAPEKLTDSERRILDDWLSESPANRQWFYSLPDAGLADYFRVVALSDPDTQFDRLNRIISQRRRQRRNKVWFAAAGIAILVAAGLWGVMTPYRKVVVARVDPMYTLPVLVLEDGRTVNIASADTVIRTAHSDISISNGEITYTATKTDRPVYNTVNIPRGKTYAMTLDDGTRVHLNAETQFTFPASFGNGEREVSLVGQAWFDVAHDGGRPFVVKAGDMNIRVLGTEFDVAAYGGGEVLSTTLYKGSVEVAVGEESILITPGTVASLDNSGELSVHEALTDAPSLWRSGVIILDEEDLTTVMHTLARHYDIDVVTESRRIGQYTFTGRIDCNKPIEEILSTLTQLGGPCFRVEDNTVYITSRN